jgi:hypothetical protein
MAWFLRTPRLAGVAAASSRGAVPGSPTAGRPPVPQAQGADLAITSAIDAPIETAKVSQGQPSDSLPEAQLTPGNGR